MDNYIDHLRVLVLKDGDGWFAAGLELDYAACGLTVEEAINNFIGGLTLTAQKRLKIENDIRKTFGPAFKGTWKDFYYFTRNPEYRIVDVPAEITQFPFNKIVFMIEQ